MCERAMSSGDMHKPAVAREPGLSATASREHLPSTANVALRQALKSIGWKSALELVREEQLTARERNHSSAEKWKAWYHIDNAELSAHLRVSPDVEDAFTEIIAAWAPTPGKLNSYDCAYYHLLQLRTIQGIFAHSGISYFPVQLFSYYWSVRQLQLARQLARRTGSLNVCEIGLGSGGASAVLLTAASSARSTRGGDGGSVHHVFDMMKGDRNKVRERHHVRTSVRCFSACRCSTSSSLFRILIL